MTTVTGIAGASRSGARTGLPKPRPTLRLALLFALSVPLSAVLLAVLGAHWPTSLFLPAMCLVLMAADLSMAVTARRLDLTVEIEDRIPLGHEALVSVRLAASPAPAAPTLFEAALEISGTLVNLASGRASGRLGGGTLELSLPLRPDRRGRLTAKNLWLRWRGPFGLCQITLVRPLDVEVDCLQNVGGLHQAALMFFHREAEAGRKTQPFKGEGSEFDSLMDFHPGMDNRLIDWKHSARHRKLLAKEFRQERNHQIVLGFDTGRLMTEPVDGVPKLDHFIRAGLLLAWVSLMSGDMVGACGFDLAFRSFLRPGRGRGFFARVQRFAAELDYRAEETNFTVGLSELHGRLPHRSLIVVFTEFIDAVSAEFLVEAVNLLARRHMIIFVTTPDPLLVRLRDARPSSVQDVAAAVIAEGFQRDRAIVLERVARLGAHCLEAPPRGLSTAILNRYLIIKQRGLL